MARRLGDDRRLEFVLGDIRDLDHLRRTLRGVDLVVHSAALKQVPAGEHNPWEMIKTNVNGAQNLIDAAIDAGVPRVLAISSDKAVCPVSLYGASKLCADKLFVAANAAQQDDATRFSLVRFGNYLGSRGSVVQALVAAARSGAVRLTDRRMTRFYVTLDHGVAFLFRSLARMRGGEIFVPKIPTIRLVDLADVLAPGVEQIMTGIRPGEKLHELMIPADEAHLTQEDSSGYVCRPPFAWWDERHAAHLASRGVPEGFEYRSDTNPVILAPPEVRELLCEAGIAVP
jgi:UDP-N-acetylglucosamine 4,6-dehydratase